jgi:hypothetical protein
LAREAADWAREGDAGMVASDVRFPTSIITYLGFPA